MRKNKERKILNIIGDFLSTFIMTIVIIIAVLLVFTKIFGWNVFTIDSSSMTPKYPVNTLVVVNDTKPEKIHIGDVITYVLNEDGMLVTHRVVNIDSQNRTFTTKGDANNTADPAPVSWENVIGKVILGIPWAGGPIRAITSRENRSVVILIVIILYAVSLLWDIIGKRKK